MEKCNKQQRGVDSARRRRDAAVLDTAARESLIEKAIFKQT